MMKRKAASYSLGLYGEGGADLYDVDIYERDDEMERVDFVGSMKRSKVSLYSQTPAVEIRVGSDEHTKSFYVHKDLLISRSPFFANAFKEGSSWLETDGVLGLPTDNPAVFALYVQIVYTGKIMLSEYGPGENDEDDGEIPELINPDQSILTRFRQAVNEKLDRLGQLYVLCERLQDIEGKDITLTAFLNATVGEDGGRFLPQPLHINYIYSGTPDESPMRKLIVDLFTLEADIDEISCCREDISAEFVFDLAVGLLGGRVPPTEGRLDQASYYYETPEDERHFVEARRPQYIQNGRERRRLAHARAWR